MNKKLKIYSTLFVVAVIFLAASDTFHYNTYSTCSTDAEEKLELVECPPEFMGTDTLPNGEVRTTRHRYVSYTVNVEPRNLPNQKVILSKSSGQTYRVNLNKVNLEVPASQVQSYYPMILILSSLLVVVVVLVWIGILVFKLIRSIRRGEIFVSKVAQYLETTGILLTTLYLYTFAVSYISTQYFISHVHIADYYIVFKNECNSMYIITGLALMIISQIILMGKDLKEEQELTI